jgi:ketopantoate reductase
MVFEKTALIGLGAVGCAYANLIKKAGLEIRIISGGERAKRIASGMVINGETVVFDTVFPGEVYGADLLLVACKFHNLNQVICDMAGCGGRDTGIVSLLNGLGAEEKLKEAYPDNTVLYCRVAGLAVVKNGSELSVGNYGMWRAGAADNTVISEPVAALAEFCRRSAFPAKSREHAPRRLVK